jgi:hypothetical protein
MNTADKASELANLSYEDRKKFEDKQKSDQDFLDRAMLAAMQSFITTCVEGKNDKDESVPNYELISDCSLDLEKMLLEKLNRLRG